MTRLSDGGVGNDMRGTCAGSTSWGGGIIVIVAILILWWCEGGSGRAGIP